SEHFAGDTSEYARAGKIAVLANRAGRGHGRKDAAQAIDESAFLIDADQWRGRNEFAHAVEEGGELFQAGDVTTEDDDATGLCFGDQVARLLVEFGARKSDE